jgi:hypothetical protein
MGRVGTIVYLVCCVASAQVGVQVRDLRLTRRTGLVTLLSERSRIMTIGTILIGQVGHPLNK